MKKTEIGELSCKILSVYSFIQALGALTLPVAVHQPTMRDHPSMLFSIATFIPATLLFLFSGLLWLSAKQLEAFSDSGQESPESASGITPQILQSIAFSVVGILILVGTLSYLVQIVGQSLHGNPLRDPWFWLRSVETLIRLALGSWLLIGSKGQRKFKLWLLENLRSVVHKDW